MHGGAAPQVRAKAQQRMLSLVAPALDRLNRIIRDPKTSDADAVRAMREVFNRAHAAGLTEKTALDLQATVEVDQFAEVLSGVVATVEDEQEPELPTFVSLGGHRYRVAAVLDLARQQAGQPVPGFDPADLNADPDPEPELEIVDAEIVEELNPAPTGPATLPAAPATMPSYLRDRLYPAR